MQLPATSDVASLIQARTKPRIGGGADTGDFTEFTRPTNAQVLPMLDRAGRAVYSKIGSWDNVADENLKARVLDLVALRTALDVERSFFPEQAAGDNSTFKSLAEQYAADMPDVIEAMREDDTGTVAGDGVLPQASGLDNCIVDPGVPVVVVTGYAGYEPPRDEW